MSKIIVVLDDRLLLSALENSLLLLGYSAYGASTLEETRRLIEQHQASLLLANDSAFSSGGEALAVLRGLRQSLPGLRILLRMKQSSPDFQIEAQRAGIDRVTEATMPVTELVTVITGLLQR
jgi:DNA-binding NtrC family response regulator